MKRVAATLLLLASLVILSACTEKRPCNCRFEIAEKTPISEAIERESVVKGFSDAEIRRCFGTPTMNPNNMPIYIVHDTPDGRYCHVGFIISAKNNPSMKIMAPISYKNWTDIDCQLRAVACLRPEAATAIAKKFGRTIDQTPIPRH